MSKRHSDALRERWGDAAYRERQTGVLFRAAKLPRVLSKRKSKMTTDPYAEIRELREIATRLKDALADADAENARLREELAGQLKSRASVVAVQHGATKRARGMEEEVAGLKAAAAGIIEAADVLASECRRVTPELYEQEIIGYETMRAALLSLLL